MSLMSLIEDSRGLFRKRRRNKAPVRGKPQPAKKGTLSAGRKRARSVSERMTDGRGREQKVRLSRVGGDREKHLEHEAKPGDSAEQAAAKVTLARGRAEKDNERARAGTEPAKSGRPQAVAGSHNAMPSTVAQGSCPSVDKASEKKESGGYDFSDVFKAVEEKKVSPVKAIIALLPDVPARELVEELEQVKRLIPHK